MEPPRLHAAPERPRHASPTPGRSSDVDDAAEDRADVIFASAMMVGFVVLGALLAVLIL